MESSEETIFQEALARETTEAREAYLLEACAGQPELLQSVRELLSAYPRGEFLEQTLTSVANARSTATAIRPDVVVGPYHLREQIGQGGMGAVYMAEQLQPVRRKVAIKIIRPGMDSHDVVRRFHREQRTLAMMDHPNIARVLDASVTETGISFFVMELVNGTPILEFCEKQASDVEQRLRLFIDCCLAIQHAHQKGIIHRDIKPSNVLVTVLDGLPVVKVIDFGIARALTSETSDTIGTGNSLVTQLGAFLGTPQYMSPEQASMGEDSLDIRTDIYSLGALLYALLTGDPPFDRDCMERATFDEVREMIRDVDPPWPSVRVRQRKHANETALTDNSMRRRLVQRLTGDLDCIVMKAMEKDRNRRYQSAGELVEDLQCFLDSKPILARLPTAAYTLSKFARRHKGFLISGVIALACLLIGLVVAIIQARHAWNAEGIALQGQARANTAESRMARLLYVADMRIATQATISGDSVGANEALEKHLPNVGEEDLRSFEWFFLRHHNKVETHELLATKKPIYHMCRISGTSQLACCGEEGVIRILEESDGRVLVSMNAEQGEVNGLASSPDGKILATSGDDGTIAFWDSETGKPLRRFQAHQRQAFQIVWSPDGTQLATCGNEKNVRIWSLLDLSEVCVFPTNRDLECLAVSKTGDLAFGAEGGLVTMTRFPDESGVMPGVRTFRDAAVEHCSALAYSEDCRFLATGFIHGKIIVLTVDPESKVQPRELLTADAVTSLVFIDQDRRIAAGLRDGTSMMIDSQVPAQPELKLTISTSVTDRAGNSLNGDRSVDGRIDLSGGTAAPAKFVDDDQLRELRESRGLKSDGADTQPPELLRMSPPLVNGAMPAGTSSITLDFSEPLICPPDTEQFRLQHTGGLNGSAEDISIGSVLASDNGTRFTLTISTAATKRRASSRPNTEVAQWRSSSVHESSTSSILLSADGNSLITSGADGRIVRSWIRPITLMTSFHQPVREFGFDAVGNLMISDSALIGYYIPAALIKSSFLDGLANRFGTKIWWPIIARNSGAIYYNSGEHVHSPMTEIFRWSPDSRTAESSYITRTGEAIGSRAVSPDERFLAILSTEHVQSEGQHWTTLWDTHRKEEIGRHPCSYVFELEFSPDSRILVYRTGESVVIVESRSGRILRTLDDRAVRGLAFSPDSQELATVSDDRMLKIWRVSDGMLLYSRQAHGVAARDVAFTSDGKTIGTVGADGLFRCWRRDVMEMTMELSLENPLSQFKFSPDGSVALIQDTQLRLFLLSAESPASSSSESFHATPDAKSH